jgi:YVTN family beta-propeller protein
VSNIYDHTISVVDAERRRVIRTMEVGRAPNGITYRGSAADGA